RRRHTRSKRDWSSDVCSSDLFYFSQLHILLFPCCVNLLLHRCSSSYFLLLHRLSHLHMLLKILYYQSVCLLYLLFFCYCIYFFLPCIVFLYSLFLSSVFSLFYFFFFLILLCIIFVFISITYTYIG